MICNELRILSRHQRYLAQISLSVFLILMFAVAFLAQTDPDPNSPTPVLLTMPQSPRAMTSDSGKNPDSSRKLLESTAYKWNSRVDLFVANLPFLPGEGANAFRAFGQDADGVHYQFPVIDLRLYDKRETSYRLTIELRDVLADRDAPSEKGDILISVAWRGLESNRVRLGIGAVGGRVNEDESPITPIEKMRPGPPTTTSGSEDLVGYRWSGDRIRFLEQATFGPTPILDERVRRIGIRTWLAEQFEAPYLSAGPYPNFRLRPTNPSPDCNGLIDNDQPDPDPLCFVNNYSMYPVQNWFYREAFYGEAQLRHRVAWALSQLWVISGVEIQQSSHMVAYHKVLSRNAFGNWRTLMREMTLNGGMGEYLNMRTSTKFSPNENYAREVLQLFNLGLYLLNPDGTLKLDQNGNPIATYDQNTVNNFTLVFTGWTLCEITGAQCPNRIPGAPNFIDPMIMANPANHDLSAKTLLNYPGSTTTNIPACTGCSGSAITSYANDSLDQALDNIYNHPNVAPFVSKFLIQQLVTGDPTPAYVGRIAAVFNANRTNPSQLKEVIRAILLDPEARGDIKTDPRYGKLREPVLYVTSIARQFNVSSADRSALSDGVLTTETNPMGQTAFMPTSVFSYYPPDYVVPGASFHGAEFALFTTGTSVTRANFGNKIIFNRIEPDVSRNILAGTSIDLDEMRQFAEADQSGQQLVDVLNYRMLHGTMSPSMRSTILNVISSVPSSDSLLRAKRAVYLVATSTQYQVQK